MSAIEPRRWIKHLEQLTTEGSEIARTADEDQCRNFRWRVSDALARMDGRTQWQERLRTLRPVPNEYEWDQRYSDETGEPLPQDGSGGVDLQAIGDRYVPWVRRRWVLDHIELLNELIASERMALTWEPSAWDRIWKALPDRLVATVVGVVIGVAAAVFGALALRAIGLP